MAGVSLSLDADDVVARRFMNLLGALREHLGGRPGWQTEAARLLGLTRPTLSSLIHCKRKLSWRCAALAATSLGMDLDYFTKTLPSDPDPCDFGFQPPPPLPRPPARQRAKPKAEPQAAVGDVFWRWTVLRPDTPALRNGEMRERVWCRCACGKEKAVWVGDLQRGRSTGCASATCRHKAVVGDDAEALVMRASMAEAHMADIYGKMRAVTGKHAGAVPIAPDIERVHALADAILGLEIRRLAEGFKRSPNRQTAFALLQAVCCDFADLQA